MRATRAKILRALARAESVGAPNVVWLDAGRRVKRTVRMANGDKKEQTFWAPRCELATGCTRAKYQKMKRAYKQLRKEGRRV